MAEEAPANSKRKVRAGSPSRRKSSAKKRKVAVHERTPEVADAIFSETSYYMKNGLRHVFPYYFTFTSYAKGRWVGSTVYDVFCKEFQSEKPEYYEFAIKSGKVTVNDIWATIDTKIKDNDVIAHKIHRHEPPVTAGDMEVVFEDDNVIVVDKPSSIPVHPCGRYRHNTVLFILSKEQGLRNLRTAHRLDRLTSGVLIIAKNLSTAQKLEAEIRNRDIQKEYVCRVKGEFPEGDVDCNEPILIVSHKLGVSKVDPSGKPCSTQFHRLSFNGTSSVVRCM
jgi:RluA family pseudouridine synthase